MHPVREEAGFGALIYIVVMLGYDSDLYINTKSKLWGERAMGFNLYRKLSGFSAVLLSGAVAASIMLNAAPLQAQTYDMKIGFATINDPQHAIARLLAETMNKRTSGRINARVFPAGQLGKIARMIEGLQFGTQEILIAPPGFLVSINAEFQVPDAPGVYDNVWHAHRALADPKFRSPYSKLANSAGIQMLALYIYGPTSFASRTPIRTISDLKGKKIRVLATKMESSLVGQFGAAGVPMPYVSVLPALQRKTIDAVRSSIIVMGGSKFFTVTKYVTVVESGMIPSSVFASQIWLKKLPADLRKMVLETTSGMEKKFTEIALDFGKKAEKLWKDNGAEVIRLTSTDQKAFMDKVKPLGDQFLGKNPKTKDMYRLLKASIERNRQ